ncbi:hypothetical protein NEOLEDRAFT_1152311 [Neolentinus lepideus HHB14362 ss-1]|uniref:Uncharacterized protein n=1 Tax=Neolentinus lepideus HHB14362 ss-1 TaxID=1314782 RepID=A0A165MWJ3_9AGAM|nr:hypothetical protein NEOLEDRAFT_1152311 [Neolentinus lepideus HHB14362 ss-1]
MTPRHPKKQKRNSPKAFEWVALSAEQASGQKDALSGFCQASDIYINHLVLTKKQEARLEELFTTGRIIDRVFGEEKEAQLQAAALLTSEWLDLDVLEALGNIWSFKWSIKTGNAKQNSRKTHQVLYQW